MDAKFKVKDRVTVMGGSAAGLVTNPPRAQGNGFVYEVALESNGARGTYLESQLVAAPARRAQR